MTIHQAFWNWADSYFKSDIDTIDIEAQYDSALTVEENIRLFKEHYPLVLNTEGKSAKETAKDIAKEKSYAEYVKTIKPNISELQRIDLNKITMLLILGDRNTAKTNLMFYHARGYKGEKPLYLMGYPKNIEGYRNVTNMQDLVNLKNSIVLIDEIDRYFNVYDRQSNKELMELLRIAFHSGLTIIGTSAVSTFITKGMEGMVDVWNLTKIRDIANLKNGSKAKRIINQTKHYSCNSWSLSLQKGEYLQFGDGLGAEYNGVKTFPDQKVSKEW